MKSYAACKQPRKSAGLSLTTIPIITLVEIHLSTKRKPKAVEVVLLTLTHQTARSGGYRPRIGHQTKSLESLFLFPLFRSVSQWLTK